MKLGIVGTGKIVGQALDALRDVPEIKVLSICAGPHNPQAAGHIAGEFSIPLVYTDYDIFLNDPENSVDLVYIGVVNSAHYSYTKKALEAGKNVMLEKPSVSTAAEFRELAALALQKHRYLTEAFTTWHSELFMRMKETLPLLGPIHLVQCNYSQYSTRYDRYLQHEVLPVFDPVLGGGCLTDINVYNLSFLAGLFGQAEKIWYLPNTGFNGVDTSGIAILKYPDFSAVAAGAKDSESPGQILIQGEKGWMQGLGNPNTLQKLLLHVNGETREILPAPFRHRMTQEFRDAASMLENDDYEEMKALLKSSEAVVSMLEEAAAAKLS